MGVSSWMVRNILSSRGTRGSTGTDKGIKLDPSRGVAENVKEILISVSKKHGVSESHQISYLNGFVKIITDENADKDFGFPTEDILLCLRPAMVHESSLVRAAALRVVKFLIQTKQDFASCIKLQYPCLLVRSLDLLLDNDCERTQALRVVRRLLSLNAAEFPISLARCLVSLTMTPPDIRDRMIRAVLGTLVELCVLNPEVFISSGGVKALTRALCNVGASSRIGETVIGALLYLVNKPETRIKAMISFDCLASPYTDPHTLGRPSETNFSTETQLQWTHFVLVSLLRSWPGVLNFCHPEKDGLRSIVNTLYLNQREIRKAVLDLLYDLLCLAQPEWSDEISVALDAVDPSKYQESFRLSDGFVAAEGKAVLPHISKSRVNLVEVHLSLLLYCFLEAGLLDAIVEVIVSDDTFLSVRATILLGELLHLIHLLLPPECCHLTPALPNLLSYAVRGRPATCINRPNIQTTEKQYTESHFQRFKRDSIQHDRQKKKESISSVCRTERVRTVSSQSCRSRTVSDSSGDRSRIDRPDSETILPPSANECNGVDYKMTSRTASVLRDVRDALSDIAEKHSKGTVGNGTDNNPYVPEFDTYTEPQIFNVPELLPLSPNPPLEYDILNEPDPVNFDPPYSSRAQQRALTAVSALSQLHRLLRKRPAPASIFLDHLITCIDRKESPDWFDLARTKGKSSSNKNKLTQLLTKECDEAIKESGVLSVKDPFIWNWDSVRAILKSKAACLYESSQRQFLRKLVQFLLPKSRQLSRIDVGIDRRAVNIYTLTGFELIDCLLQSPEESECEKLLIDLLTDISNEIGSLLSSKSAHDCLFSPQYVLNTLLGDYFFYIGHLSRTTAGYKVLEKVGIMQQLYDLVSTTNHECYVKIIVSVLDYTSDTLARKIISKALSSQNLSCRLYCTKLLHVILRTPLHNNADMIDWVVELLVGRLYDEDRAVVNAAILAFDEACDCKEYLEAIVKLRPSLLHLGDSGLLLLIRFLSTNEGFMYLQEANFVSTQLERWATHYNYKYVCLIESQLCDSLTLHQRGEDGRYCARISGAKHSPSDVFLPPHLYGQLTQHEAGFNTLKQDENIQKLIKTVILGHCRTDDEILQLKAALWALGHISCSPEGAKWARNNRVTMAMIHTVRFSQVYSVRATAFYALSITATNPEGATTLRSAGWHTVRHHRHEKWPVLASMDVLEDVLLVDNADNDKDLNRTSVYSNDGVDQIGKSGIFYLPKDPSTTTGSTSDNDEFMLNLPGSSGMMPTITGKSATLPHYIGSGSGMGSSMRYHHNRSVSESKADTVLTINDINLTPQQSQYYYDASSAIDINDIRAVGDVTRKSRSDSCTTGSSSGGISNISGVSLNDSSSISAGKHHNSVISDRVQTLSPIPSAGSLSTVKSSGHGQVRKSSFTANVSKRKSNSRLSHQDALGYATLRILHRGRRPLPATVPALSPLSPIELIAFQDLRQMSPLVRPRHSVNKPLMSEFEAHSVKLSHLLSEVGVPPTLPYQSSHSCITCPSGLPTPDDDTAWSGPCYMGICLPQRLAELFPDDDEEPRLPRTAAKETYNRQMTDSNIDPGVENISSAESETDTGTDTGGCGVINVPMEVPIKRRHNRNSCLLCSGGNRNNQRVSRWRKVSASSSHRTRTETESSYGGAPGEGESPIMLPWQTKGGLEGVNSIDSSSTDVTSIAQRSVSDNLKSRSMVRRDVLKFVEQLSNPVLYKTCKQALLHLKQTYSDVFQDVCVYCDVYNIMSSTSHRIQSRRFLQELFLDIPFTELYEESVAILGGGESGEEFDEESIAAVNNASNSNNMNYCQNELQNNNGSHVISNSNNSDNNYIDIENDNDITSNVNIGSRLKTNNNLKTLQSQSLSSNSSSTCNNNASSMMVLLEVIPENDARSDSSEPCKIESRDSIVSDSFIMTDIALVGITNSDINKKMFTDTDSSSQPSTSATVSNIPKNIDSKSSFSDDVEIKNQLLSLEHHDDFNFTEVSNKEPIINVKKEISTDISPNLLGNKVTLGAVGRQETEKAKEIIKTTSNKITELQESLKSVKNRDIKNTTKSSGTVKPEESSIKMVKNSFSCSSNTNKNESEQTSLSIKSSFPNVESSELNKIKSKTVPEHYMSNIKNNKNKTPDNTEKSSEKNSSIVSHSIEKQIISSSSGSSKVTSAPTTNPTTSSNNSKRQRKKATTKVPNRESLEVGHKKEMMLKTKSKK